MILFILFTMSSVFANVGVVVIDMQKGFFDIEKTRNTKEVKLLLSRHVELLNWAKLRKAPVVVFEYRGKGKTDSVIMNAIKGMDAKVITKTMDDGFSEMSSASRDEAHRFLQTRKIKTLIVTGINGGSCVMETIQGAGLLGYFVKTSPDLVGDLWSNPPLYPDSSWVYNDPKFKVYQNIKELLK